MSTIPGEYCGQYALDENNFLTKLKELNRDQLTNGLINELALWSKKNKQTLAAVYEDNHMSI